MTSLGADGLTLAEIVSSREAFWDDRFSAFLLEALPTSTRSILDVGCGIGTAAMRLLPLRADLSYAGVDIDAHRIAAAEAAVLERGLSERARFFVGNAAELSAEDASTDAVLCSMTLQHLRDPLTALREARRVLSPDGVLLAVEPDNLASRWYFDGPLDDLDDAMGALRRAARAARTPADSAIGPRVASLALEAGFSSAACVPYAVGALRRRTFADLAGDVRRIVAVLTRMAGSTDPSREVLVRLEALDRIHRDRDGFGGQIAVVFRTLAR